MDLTSSRRRRRHDRRPLHLRTPSAGHEFPPLGAPLGAAVLATFLATSALAVEPAGGLAASARPLGRELPVFEAPADPDAAAEPTVSPKGVLRLADALAAALESSPALAAYAFEIRRREALALQAGLLPNPVLSVDAEDFVGPSQRKSLGYQQTTVSLAQLVELGGKRGARRRLAERQRDLAGWDFEAQRIAVLSDTTKAFLDVLALQERRTLLSDLESVAAEMLRSVASTVRAGAVSPVEEDRAHVNLDRVQLDAARAENELVAARVMLASTWGQVQPRFETVAGDLWTLPPLPDPEALDAAAEVGPELARWRAEIAERESSLAVERAARVPDVVVSLAGRHHPLGAVGGVVAGVSVPIPVFDRNQGGQLAARDALARARAERRRSGAGIRSAIAATHQALVLGHRTATTLRDEIIPRADRVFERTRRGYATGLFRYVEVLDAERTLFAARRELIDALLALHLAATDLERLTGTPLTELARRESR